MIKKLLPIVLLFVGTGAGVGAGIFLRPPPPEHDATAPAVEGGHAEENEADGHADAHDGEDDESTKEYVKLNNQFVIPVIKGEKVVALVVMALSVEVPEGQKEAIFLAEPKLRDSFLQVLFDHANIGGFEGAFTDANTLAVLRGALKEVAQKDMGKDVVSDVLILDIARQDY